MSCFKKLYSLFFSKNNNRSLLSIRNNIYATMSTWYLQPINWCWTCRRLLTMYRWQILWRLWSKSNVWWLWLWILLYRKRNKSNTKWKW